MGRFDRGSNRFGGSRSFGRPRFGGRDSGAPRSEMFKAVCSRCGKDCEVPFRPSGDKPVFCSNCFEEQGGRQGQDRDSGRRSFDRPRGGDRDTDRRMYEAVCDECGNTCKVPFQPTSGKPIYCSNCFESKDPHAGGNQNRESRSSNTNQYAQEFEKLNAKMDRILGLLIPKVKPEVVSEKTPAKVVKAKKTPDIEPELATEEPKEKVVKKRVAKKKE